MKANSIKEVKVSDDRNTCDVFWNDGHVSRFHCKWLRFNCRCSTCEDVETVHNRQKVECFPDEMAIEKVKFEENHIYLNFAQELFEGHVGEFASDWLRSYCYCDVCLKQTMEDRDVISKQNAKKVRPLRIMEYEEIAKDQDAGLFKLIENVIENGFCVMKNVPDKVEMIEEMAEKLGGLIPNSYGRTWHVKAQGAVNAAYTNAGLPLHQDMMVYAASPGVLIIIVKSFDPCVIGGESLYVDGFKAAEILRKESPEDFKTLVEVPGSWAMHDSKVFQIAQETQKPHIILDYFGEIVGINWGVTLTAPIRVKGKDVDRYYKAWKTFVNILKRKENMFRFKLETGDMLVVNNRRMVHGREPFEANGGKRYFQGCYADIDNVKNLYVTLARKLGRSVVPPKVGNMSSV